MPDGNGELTGSRVRGLETSEEGQAGNGIPAHTAADGTPYWDYTNTELYINDSGVGTFGNSWQHIGGGGVPVPHQLLDNPWHDDTATNAPLRGAMTVGNAVPLWTRVVHPGAGAATNYWRANAADPGWAAIVAGDLPNLGAMPALAYGVANAPGAAATYVRTDATIDIFDAIVPVTIQCDDPAAVGVAVAAARRDHAHGIVNAIAVNIGNANAEGVSTSFSRADHVHDHVAGLGVNLHHNEAHVVNSTGPHAEAGLTIGHVLRASGAAAFSFAAIQAGDLPGLGGVPNLTLGIANAAGAAATYIQTDAQIAIFDAVVPTTIRADDPAAAGVIAFAARRDHVHGFPTVAPVNIGNANAEGTAYDFVRSDHVHNHPAGLGTDLHHAQVHVVNSTGPHAEAGLTIGHVLRATGAAAFSFAALIAADLPAHTHANAGQGGQLDWDDVWSDAVHSHANAGEGGQLDWDDVWSDAVHSHANAGEGGTITHAITTGRTANDHHNEAHVVNSTGPHAEAGLTPGHFLRATGAAAFSFAAIQAGDLPAHGGTHDVGAGDPVTTTSDGAANHNRILASSAAGAITMDDYFVPDGGTIGIAGNELIVFDAAGDINVAGAKFGINVAAPARQFEVNSGGANVVAVFTSTDAVARIHVEDSATTDDSQVGIGAIGDNLQLYAGGVARAVVLSGGNFGINVAAPARRFEVNSGTIDVVAVFTSTDQDARIQLEDNTTTSDTHVGIGARGDGMFLVTNNSISVMILANGNIGVNTLTPDRLLHPEATDASSTSMLYALRIGHRNTAAAGSSLFGVGMEFELEDSAGNMQVAAEISTLWGDATSGSEQPLVRISPYARGSIGPGNFGLWTFDGIAGGAEIIIPNGINDVTISVWLHCHTIESAGGIDSQSIRLDTPGAGVVTGDVYDDGVDVLTATLASTGQLTIARSAGAATFNVICSMLWM